MTDKHKDKPEVNPLLEAAGKVRDIERREFDAKWLMHDLMEDLKEQTKPKLKVVRPKLRLLQGGKSGGRLDSANERAH